MVLISIIKRAFPLAEIEQQIRVGSHTLDIKLTVNGKTIFIEFDGPSHFASNKYGIPRDSPFRKKMIVEDKTQIEVVNWPYWIQRCERNVRAIFDNTIRGFAVLWSTNVHFGSFIFENSVQIIETLTNRFNAVDNNGFGHIYGEKTLGRNNPEHPIINRIITGKSNMGNRFITNIMPFLSLVI